MIIENPGNGVDLPEEETIGSNMWHLATNDEDRRRLASEPDLMPTAVEEFTLAEGTQVRWSTGQIRGPRQLPFRIPGRCHEATIHLASGDCGRCG